MNWKGCGRKQPWFNIRYCPNTSLQIMWNTKTGQDSRSEGRGLNSALPSRKQSAPHCVICKNEFCGRSCDRHTERSVRTWMLWMGGSERYKFVSNLKWCYRRTTQFWCGSSFQAPAQCVRWLLTEVHIYSYRQGSGVPKSWQKANFCTAPAAKSNFSISTESQRKFIIYRLRLYWYSVFDTVF
jgi:hypothetical protein